MTRDLTPPLLTAESERAEKVFRMTDAQFHAHIRKILAGDGLKHTTASVLSVAASAAKQKRKA